MKLIAMLVTFAACNPLIWKAAEDGIVGEIKVAEQVASDLSTVNQTGSATQQAPDVMVPIKKF